MTGPGDARARTAPAPVAAYVVKTAIADREAADFVFPAEKTMYGGRHVAAGDALFVFDSENAGGSGLLALAVVVAAEAVPPRPGGGRQTPRVSLAARRVATAGKPLGRRELKAFRDWADGRPETELNFKLYRQATDKLVGISAQAAALLRGYL